tara:strand:+ start:26615 stop:27070 length:456 start_codon:yes stop_codon:yes gene_type:complete
MAVKNVRSAPLPLPPENYSAQYMIQFLRVLELYFNQLDSFAPNQAESYIAENFYGGAFSETSTAFTASGSISAGTSIALADASLGTVTVTLPSAALSKGLTVTVKKVDTTGLAVVVDGDASETIDGGTTATITTPYVALKLHCDGTQWWVV